MLVGTSSHSQHCDGGDSTGLTPVRHKHTHKTTHTLLEKLSPVRFLRHTVTLVMFLRVADQDVVDGDVDQLHEEADEAHDEEANARRDRNLGELCAATHTPETQPARHPEHQHPPILQHDRSDPVRESAPSRIQRHPRHGRKTVSEAGGGVTWTPRHAVHARRRALKRTRTRHDTQIAAEQWAIPRAHRHGTVAQGDTGPSGLPPPQTASFFFWFYSPLAAPTRVTGKVRARTDTSVTTVRHGIATTRTLAVWLLALGDQVSGVLVELAQGVGRLLLLATHACLGQQAQRAVRQNSRRWGPRRCWCHASATSTALKRRFADATTQRVRHGSPGRGREAPLPTAHTSPRTFKMVVCSPMCTCR